MGASLVVEGSTNRTVFKTYLEDVLCPTLERGQVVVMDNLSAHKGERVRQLIEGEGSASSSTCRPIGPDFNPIEGAFSKIKSYLRAACAGSQDTLMEVIGEALSTISTTDALGYFEHCGYRAVSSHTPKLGPWGVYGEAIGNPKFYIGTDPQDSEFLQAAQEFASAHEDVLRELAKH